MVFDWLRSPTAQARHPHGFRHQEANDPVVSVIAFNNVTAIYCNVKYKCCSPSLIAKLRNH